MILSKSFYGALFFFVETLCVAKLLLLRFGRNTLIQLANYIARFFDQQYYLNYATDQFYFFSCR